MNAKDYIVTFQRESVAGEYPYTFSLYASVGNEAYGMEAKSHTPELDPGIEKIMKQIVASDVLRDQGISIQL